MTMSRKFKEYRKVVNELGLKVLDIYRLKDKELIRGLYKGKVVLIELPKHREDLAPKVFREIIEKTLGSIK